MRNISLQAKIRQISQKLSDIMEQDSDEKVMVFTDNKALQELCAQINRLLADRQKIKADYRKKEISYKKMLSNISHDIKTPLTVILGYLEMMRLADGENEELRKVEAKAGQVMELIDRFFTLAKLEAGDMELEIGRINVSELCRESMLGYYDILQGKDFTVELSIPEKDNRLYTLEDSRNREIQGNGLGLTIAKNLALQLGGDIFLESEPNVKTTFTVKLNKTVR